MSKLAIYTEVVMLVQILSTSADRISKKWNFLVEMQSSAKCTHVVKKRSETWDVVGWKTERANEKDNQKHNTEGKKQFKVSFLNVPGETTRRPESGDHRHKCPVWPCWVMVIKIIKQIDFNAAWEPVERD